MSLRFRDPESARLYLRNRSCAPAERLELAEYGFTLRYTNPPEMVAWCDAALEGLDEVEPDVAARLHGYAGNAKRIVGDFPAAEQSLRRALSLSLSDPLLLEFWASFLRDMRRLDEANSALAQAAQIRRGQVEPLPLASTLMQSAIVLDVAGKPSSAVLVVYEAIMVLESASPSERAAELLLIAVQNLALYLTNSGRPKDALRLIRQARPALGLFAGGASELRTEWLLAKISAALGDHNAERALRKVRERMLSKGMLQDAALASLDLARFLLAGSPFEARAEVSFVEPIFKRMGLSEGSREYQLLRVLLDSALPDLQVLSELIVTLAHRKCSGEA